MGGLVQFDTEQPSHNALRGIVAERSQRLVIWVGAGLSRAAGVPTWPELRALLTSAARKQASARPENSERDLAAIAAIERIESHWTAFERLQDVLGEPTYAAQLKLALATADNKDPPDRYLDLWRLSPRGMITLNLDRFAARSFAVASPGKVLNEIDAGAHAGQYGAILQSNTPLVLNAHGVLQNRSSWVFGAREIDRLLGTESYRSFVNSVVATSVVLFVGISADDVASGGFLARLLQSGFSAGEHFWLTSRGDDETRAYADRAGIQPIYYSAARGHEIPVAEFCADLLRHKSHDEPAPPVRHSGARFSVAKVDPADAPNSVRKALAAMVDAALEAPAPTKEIDKIVAKNERALHTAWYVATVPPHNEFFDYTIEEKIGEGGFGRVYRARDKTGKLVALKVLRQEILEKRDLVGSFRRGVKSMRILSTRNVAGMVPYLDAYELPPSVVMEYVEGPNLQQLCERGDLKSLGDILDISCAVARIVHRGHMLPERVLHRDIRPANVMVKDYYHSGLLDNIVVLDFDLSWHRGSDERSIDLSAVATMGYMAPELMARTTNASSRSTSVDVFGLAMTMYYMIAGKHPYVGSIYASDWSSTVLASVEPACRDVLWRSLPRRLARLLVSCTNSVQSARPDMPSMIVELERIRAIVTAPDDVASAELLTEELAARAGEWRRYEWDLGTLACTFRLPSGVSATLTPDEVQGSVGLAVSYTDTGQVERRGVSRYIVERKSELVERLRAAGWRDVVGHADGASLGVTANAASSTVAARLAQMADALTAVLARIGME